MTRDSSMGHLRTRRWRGALLGLLAWATLAPAQAVENITYYHLDALGSPVAATDAQGNVIWREEYKPYGERLNNPTAAADNTRWYTGHPHDEATGLTYAGARYYDPVVGRFMGADPIAFSDNKLHSFNQYSYANNNPYSNVDLDGLEALSIAVSAKIDMTSWSHVMPWALQLSGGVEFGVVVSWPTRNPDDNGNFDIGVFSSKLRGASATTGKKGIKFTGGISASSTSTIGGATDLENFDEVTVWNFGLGGGHDVNRNGEEVGGGYHVGPGFGFGGFRTDTEVWSTARGASRAAAAMESAVKRELRELIEYRAPLPR